MEGFISAVTEKGIVFTVLMGLAMVAIPFGVGFLIGHFSPRLQDKISQINFDWKFW